MIASRTYKSKHSDFSLIYEETFAKYTDRDMQKNYFTVFIMVHVDLCIIGNKIPFAEL